MKKLYFYEGPVNHFERCIDKKYTGLTVASSEKEARNNLAFRYKMEKGFECTSRIYLPGKIKAVS